MHLPGPLRAAAGLVASAADEAKHLPERAIELPMLAVSTVLQLSLRAQQRYAMLAARGDALLNGREPGDDPPPWATFDDDLVVGGGFGAEPEAHREAVLAQFDGYADIVTEPAADAASQPVTEVTGVVPPADVPDDNPVVPAPMSEDNVTPIRAAARKTAHQTAPATKVAARKVLAKKVTTRKAPAGKTGSAASASSGKRVNKPRHTAPSKFDDIADDLADDLADD